MDFSKYISTPAGQTEANPLVTRLKLTKGRLVGGFLYFPPGPSGMLHFVARIGLHQILPFNTGENLRLNDAVFPFLIGIDLSQPPYLLDLITWNDSTLYDHALTVSFSFDPALAPGYDITDLKHAIEGKDLSHE